MPRFSRQFWRLTARSRPPPPERRVVDRPHFLTVPFRRFLLVAVDFGWPVTTPAHSVKMVVAVGYVTGIVGALCTKNAAIVGVDGG